MTLRSLLIVASFLNLIGLASLKCTSGQTTSPSPAISPPSISTLPAYSPAPYEKRLAAAKSVKVMMSILGLELGSTIEEAHAKLDKFSDPAHPPKEEGEEGEEPEHKVLWQLAKTDYSFVFAKADEKERITYISGFLRPGKQIAFEKIGETKKAPMQDANTIVWDVVRPNRPFFRVVAKGAGRKADTIMIFVVKRPGR